jgi:ribose 5-phosphate isomerase B
MKILIASDHAGFELKEKLKSFLKELEYEVEDKGAFEKNDNDDYPDFIAPVAEAVSKDPENVRGIVLGGSGQGEAITANRFPNVRAAVFYGSSLDIVTLSREHNNANILSLGARFLKETEAIEAVKLWLGTSFSGDERHVRRIRKIDEAYG